MLDNGREQVFYENSIDLYGNKFTPETPRKRRENAIMVVNRVVENNENQQEEAEKEPVRTDFNSEDFAFEDEPAEDTVPDDPNWGRYG